MASMAVSANLVEKSVLFIPHTSVECEPCQAKLCTGRIQKHLPVELVSQYLVSQSTGTGGVMCPMLLEKSSGVFSL